MKHSAAIPPAKDSPSSKAAAWYCVAVLLIAYVVSFIDRSILTTLVEPIQRDLGINDTEIALMHGFAFSIFYVTLGIPMGYLCDRVNRTRLIAVCVFFWSIMTMACGLARSFGQLFLARVGVGVGESALSPATYSMISDYFPPAQRSLALGIFQMGVYVGSGIAIIVGGAIVAFVGHHQTIELPVIGVVRSWQAVFMIVGAPGLLVALLVMTIREPARKNLQGATERAEWSGLKSSLSEVWRTLRGRPGLFGLHFIGFAMCGVPVHVCLLWARPYLSREFSLDAATASYIVGGLLLIFSTAGTVLGGTISDTIVKRGHLDGPIRVGIAAALVAVIPIGLLPLAPTVPYAAVALAALLFLCATPFGGAAAALLLITPPRMRGQMSAVYLLCMNLVGLAVAPVLTGVLTDYVFIDPNALVWSMAIVATIGVLTSVTCLSLVRKRYIEAAISMERLDLH